MKDRPGIEDTIEWLRGRGYYEGQIAHQQIVKGQSAETDDLAVSAPLSSALQQEEITSLYSHQVNAIEAVQSGSNVVVATPTASGKTLTYVVPGIERAIENAGKTLYIAPYRALINDQADTFEVFDDELGFDTSIDIGVQTGETSKPDRKEIRQTQPDILLTTIDQLHLSLLPYAHGKNHWRWLFQQLDTVVIDEVHMYRGVFGSHASLIFRRLNRLCDYYDSSPQYICCSATIGNPVEHASTVTGQKESTFELVDDDGSASGDRHWLFWNPPLKQDADQDQSIPDPAVSPDGTVRAGHEEHPPEKNAAAIDTESSSTTDTQSETSESSDSPDEVVLPSHQEVVGGERRSHHVESVRLFCDLVTRGYQTLVFTAARQGTEQYVDWADRMLRNRGQYDLADSTHAYHAALNTGRRLKLEEELRSGDARGVWSTNALELGIDIGTLDVVLLDGYPGTSMSTFQRAGRAGRGEDTCLVVLVGADDPLDQYTIRDPDELFEGGAEQAAVNPSNNSIRPDHVVCAASDHFLSPRDEDYFGADLPDIVTEAEVNDRLRRVESGDRIQWRATDSDVQWNTNIRAIDDREIDLIDRNRDEKLASLEFGAAVRDAHPDAIYRHQKQTYQVVELDLESDRALLESTPTAAYTRALREKSITIEDTYESSSAETHEMTVQATLGEFTVEDTVTGYLRYSDPSDDTPQECEFEEPLESQSIKTTGLFITVPDDVEAMIVDQAESQEEYLSALHAIEHALISLFPMEVLCDRGDIGGLSTPSHGQTSGGTVFIHDGHPGGAGLTRQAFEQLDDLLEKTLTLLQDCGCQDGCPSCIHSPHCGNANRSLNKQLAIQLLEELQ
ncbi:DEAD/DEAH box helicase [Halobacterium salinarum]|uniref:DEAD/DEAH box helicase n=1 Tax=Halobacterium salinarum TaxID=2242 RepID=UPI0025530D50|nr:DEAD/DEAH box helicase [Halobacterium salinarum]MDL0128446.1 DEAD/DEAH box helicase [Halobacterium salinarum]